MSILYTLLRSNEIVKLIKHLTEEWNLLRFLRGAGRNLRHKFGNCNYVGVKQSALICFLYALKLCSDSLALTLWNNSVVIAAPYFV